MDFPREAKYLLDWSPSCGLMYSAFLERKHFEPVAELMVAETLLPHIASLEHLAARGFQPEAQTPENGFYRLRWSFADILRTADLSNGDIATSLRWGLVRLEIGLPHFGNPPKRDTEAPLPSWPYEQFELACDEYKRGQYAEALASVIRAISGDRENPGYAREYRFHYLLGRLRLGAWCGEYRNISVDIVDPYKAEAAFTEAERCLKDMRSLAPEGETLGTEHALMLLWAGRAAYVQGRFDHAITNTQAALALIAPDRHGLLAAAHYQLARALHARRAVGDSKAAAEALKHAFYLDVTLVVEAAADPEFAVNTDLLESTFANTAEEMRATLKMSERNLADGLARARRYSYDGITAIDLLKDEYTALIQTQDEMTRHSKNGGILDLDAASRIAEQMQPQCASLFPLFKSRFAADRWHTWENLAATKAAKDADIRLRHCRETFAAADGVYRRNGGYDRSGGGEKILYGVVLLVLSFYMLYADIRWQSQTAMVALLFLVGAGWLFMLYARKRLGLVPGLDAMRRARGILILATADAEQKERTAAQIWVSFQRSIDALNQKTPPF